MNLSSYFQHKALPSLGLLAFRLVLGSAFILHGLGKVQHATSWMGNALPGPLQAIAAFSEFGGGISMVLGLLSPLGALALIGTMIGALALVHFPSRHPFVTMDGPSFELALGYLAGSLLLLLNSPGKFSVDYYLAKSLSSASATNAQTQSF